MCMYIYIYIYICMSHKLAYVCLTRLSLRVNCCACCISPSALRVRHKIHTQQHKTTLARRVQSSQAFWEDFICRAAGEPSASQNVCRANPYDASGQGQAAQTD